MISFTCDMCGKPLLVDEETRYVVKIEVYAAYDPMELTEDDINEDHSDELCRLCEQMEAMDPDEAEDSVYRTFQLDLCPECQKDYLKNPLPRTPRNFRSRRFGSN